MKKDNKESIKENQKMSNEGVNENESEVRIVIHRGSKEIGGTCIQLSTEQCSILLDIGHPLSPESKPVDVAKTKADAVLISHPVPPQNLIAPIISIG